MAYNHVFFKLNEKQIDNPEVKKQQEEKAIIVETAAKSTSESILKDLSNLKLRSLQYIDDL